MLRVARLMRQTAAILTLSGVLTLIQATYLAITQDWSKIFDALGMIDDFTISYWLLVGAAACETVRKPIFTVEAGSRLVQLIQVRGHHEYQESGRHRLHGNYIKTDGVALGERPPAFVDSRAHARLRVPDGRRRGIWCRPEPLRRRAGTGRRAGQAWPRRPLRPLSTSRSMRRGPRGCACPVA